jgi:RNA polymerase sigma-70 factor (ECF subfamily)
LAAHLRLTPRPAEPPERASWDDDALLTGLERGDVRAARGLYDHLRPAIEHALRRVLHHRVREVDDLVQTTFARLLEALASGRFEARSSLRTWASAIAAHVALDALRAQYRERSRLGPGLDPAELGGSERPEARLEALAELQRVQAILARMKPALAEALVLHDVLGHELGEVARLSGLTPSAAQSRLHRGRLELRRRAARPIAPGGPGAS